MKKDTTGNETETKVIEKKYKIVNYNENIKTVAHLANYIKVHDVFTDEKRKELYDKFELLIDNKGNKKDGVD